MKYTFETHSITAILQAFRGLLEKAGTPGIFETKADLLKNTDRKLGVEVYVVDEDRFYYWNGRGYVSRSMCMCKGNGGGSGGNNEAPLDLSALQFVIKQLQGIIT